MAIEFANLNLGADPRMRDIDPGKRNGFAEDRRPCCAGDHADLSAADMDAIAMSHGFVGLDV